MTRQNDTLIIIPAYNEEKNIYNVVKRVCHAIADVDVIVINDGSADQTEREAKRAGAKVLSLPFNMGYGVAVQTGYKFADHRGYRYVAQIDGDGQHDPTCLNDLLEPLKQSEADYVLGSRFLEERSYTPPFMRRVGMRMFANIVSWITNQRVYDPTSGFIAFNHRVLHFFTLDHFPNDYPDANLLVEIYYEGYKLKEVPVCMYENEEGKSMHDGFKPVYYTYKMCIAILSAFLRKKLGYKQGGS